ncbi:SET domain-containing protein-lysine N-methyltransferase [Solemya pervernicosa gill symbiont]
MCEGKPTGVAATRDNHSLQVGYQAHVDLDEPAQVFSHSCEPNLYINNNEFGGYNFYAVRDIEPGEMLAFHYGMSEANSIAVSECHCGADDFYGRSVGFKEAEPHLQHYLHDLGVAEYLSRWYKHQMPSS